MNDKENDKKQARPILIAVLGYLVVCIILVLVGNLIDTFTIDQIDPTYVTYEDLKKVIDNKEVFALYLDERSSIKIRFQYTKDVPDTVWDKIDEQRASAGLSVDKDALRDPSLVSIMDLDKDKWYYTNYVDTESFNEMVLNSGIPLISNKFTSYGLLMLSLVLAISPTALLILLLYLMISVIGAQMKLGDSKYEVSKETGIKFEDVIGHDEVIDDIKNYVKLLQNSAKLKEMKVKPPKGILFTGAPGTGKTLMAKAMAQEAGVPFIYLNTSSVIELFVGQGAKAIRSTFKKARELAPCIVFLDEIDAIGGKRGKQFGTSEDTQTLLALLQELDGFKDANGILVIAATNAPDTLDPALKRSGRFDREIVISLPQNRKVRKALLEHYTKDFELDEDVDLEKIAATLAGMSGADIANICNEAATQCVLRGSENHKLTNDDFTTAVDKLLLKGNKLKNKSLVNEKDRQLVAYHEAGHAVVSYLLGEPISRISIQGTTSGVGGFVLQEDKDTQFQTEAAMLHRIQVCYGGRISEVIKYGNGNATQGASNDIEQATNLMFNYIAVLGFNKDMGLVNYKALVDAGILDAREFNKKISDMSKELYDDTARLLASNYFLVESLATALLDSETMLGAEALELLDKTKATAETKNKE